MLVEILTSIFISFRTWSWNHPMANFPWCRNFNLQVVFSCLL